MTREESALLFGHLNRKKYIEAMESTNYGWKPSSEFPNVGCPSDLEFISPEEDGEGTGRCLCSCQECWEYILNNKKW